MLERRTTALHQRASRTPACRDVHIATSSRAAIQAGYSTASGAVITYQGERDKGPLRSISGARHGHELPRIDDRCACSRGRALEREQSPRSSPLISEGFFRPAAQIDARELDFGITT